MNFNLKQSKIFEYIDLMFKLSFLSLGFLNFNSVFFGRSFLSYVVILTVALGGICFAYRIYNVKNYINNIVLWLLMAFLVSYGITMVIFRRYGMMSPMKTWAWLGMQVLLLYATDCRKSTDDFQKEMQIILSFFVLVTFISSCISFIYLFNGYHQIRQFEVNRIITGFVWGRLWGVYTDPNFASVMAVLSILISLYGATASDKKYFKAFFIVNIISQILYVSFSDSRSGKVTATVGIALYAFLNLLIKFSTLKTALKMTLCLLMSAVIGLGVFYAIKTVKIVYNNTVIYLIQDKGYSGDDDIYDEQSKDEKIKGELIGREKDIENDISNRRFDLWGSALETLKTQPIFGVSFDHLVTYAKEKLPNTYLINNDHGVFANYHNVLFNILVGQGIFGFLIFITAALIAGIKSIKHLAKTLYTEYGKANILFFSILIVVLLSSMFLQEIVYTLSPSTFIFWLILGYLTKNIKGEKLNG